MFAQEGAKGLRRGEFLQKTAAGGCGNSAAEYFVAAFAQVFNPGGPLGTEVLFQFEAEAGREGGTAAAG